MKKYLLDESYVSHGIVDCVYDSATDGLLLATHEVVAVHADSDLVDSNGQCG